MKGILTVALKNLRHRFVPALGLVLLIAALFSGGSLLRFLIRRQAEAIEAMTAQTSIRCVVTNASGTRTAGIGVCNVPFAEMLQGKRRDRGCTIDDFVSDLQLAAKEDLTVPEKGKLIRANCPDALAPDCSVRFDDLGNTDSLSGTEWVCCISENLYGRVDANGMLTVQRRFYEPISLRVVGTVLGADDVVVCPFDAQLVAGSSEAFAMDRCSFTLSDTRRLDEAKAAFAEWFVTPSLQNGDNAITAALLIQDGEYIAATDELQAHIALLHRLRVLLLVMSGMLGLLIGFLMNRKRLKEFAVMRCLGLKRMTVMLSVALEQLLPMLPGIAIGVCVGLVLLPDGSGLLDGCLQMLPYLCGGLLCAWLLTRAEPIRLMKEEE